MNIPPTPNAATTSLAGVSRAAARGGEHEKRLGEAARQQQVGDAPAGKAADEPSVDAGDATGDRGGDGRQIYDLFEKQSSSQEQSSEESPSSSVDQTAPPSEHIDFEA